MRSCRRLTPVLSLVAVIAVADAGTSTQDDSVPSESTVVATPLHAAKTVQFGDGQWLAWKHPPACDAEGNVFLVLIPKADPRDLRVAPEDRRHVKKPSDILRIGADGKKTIIRPAGVPAAANADEVVTIGVKPDPSGTLHALVWAVRGQEGDGNLYLVSFKDDGRYKSHFEIPPEEISAQDFEFFGSGSILVRGFRPFEGPRVAVMSAGGGSFRDVGALSGPGQGASDAPGQEGAASQPRGFDRVARAGDGRIYVVPGGTESVYVIDESGDSQRVFELAPMGRDVRLVDLKASGQRLAAMYYEDKHDRRAHFWMAVYDVSVGERVALYGPADGAPFCYVNRQGQDRFTVMKDAKYLVTLSSP